LSDSPSQPPRKTQNSYENPDLVGRRRDGLWVAILLGIYLRIGMISHSHDVFRDLLRRRAKVDRVKTALFLHTGLCVQSIRACLESGREVMQLPLGV
jgi:hypothetical protein